MDNNNSPESMARITTKELADAFIAEQVAEVRAQVGDKKVLLVLSGGVDSSVVAALLLPKWFSIFGVALGVLSLKFSAYLQPLTHKVLQNFINKGR